MDRSLSGATIPGKSGPGSNANEGVLCISQSLIINGTAPSDCLESYLGHSFGGAVLPLCRGAVGVFYSPCRRGNTELNVKTVLFQIFQFSIST